MPSEATPPTGGSTRLVLASASPRRRDILSLLGVPFEIVAPRGVDEKEAHGGARETVRTLAVRKAETVLLRLLPTEGRDPEIGLRVLGLDTVIAVGEPPSEQVLGKPESAGDASRMLRLLSGLVHSVWTGVALARPGLPTRVESEKSQVTFRALTDEEIRAYVSSGEPLGKAGSYAIQGEGASLVAGFTGCYHNIVGLPLVLVSRMLELVVPECECQRHPLQRGKRGCIRT